MFCCLVLNILANPGKSMLYIMQNSRGAAALGFVPIIVIALALAYYLAVSTSTNFITPTSNSSGSSCSTPYTGYDTSNPITVLAISPGSTGTICIRYTNPFNNTGSITSYIRIYQYNSSGTYGVCSSCGFNIVTSEFDANASPSSVAYSPGQGPQDVTYKIGVPSNVTSGIYGIFLLQFCSLFPMVVEPINGSAMQLSSADFSSWYPHNGSCPLQFLNAQILGVSGFSVESVDHVDA